MTVMALMLIIAPNANSAMQCRCAINAIPEMCSPGCLGHAALPTSSSGAPNMLDEVSYLQAFGVTHACKAPSVLGRPCAKWFCPVLITEALRSAGLPSAAHRAIGNKNGLTGLDPSSLSQLQPVPQFSSSPSSWMRASPFRGLLLRGRRERLLRLPM